MRGLKSVFLDEGYKKLGSKYVTSVRTVDVEVTVDFEVAVVV